MSWQLLALLLGVRFELAAFDAKLAGGELARASHRNPLAEGHGSGAGDSCHAREQDECSFTLAPATPITRAKLSKARRLQFEHRGAQRIASHGMVASLDPAERAAFYARCLGEHRLQDTVCIRSSPVMPVLLVSRWGK